MPSRLHKRPVWILAAGFLTIIAMSQPVQAEPPIQTSPVTRGLLKGALITAGAIGKTLSEVSPSCSQSLEKCWDTHGMNKDNYEQVQDACWKETTQCPQVCKDQYFSFRKAGMKSPVAENKVLFGKPPCAPGVE